MIQMSYALCGRIIDFGDHSGPGQPTYTHRADPRSSLVWLGDASIHALHPYWDTEITSSHIQYQPINLCIAGETIASLKNRLAQGLLDGLAPRLIIINIGMNDLPKMKPSAVADGIVELSRSIGLQNPVPLSVFMPWCLRGIERPIRLGRR